MPTSSPAFAFDEPAPPIVLSAAHTIAATLSSGIAVSRGDITRILTQCFGGSDAEGRWSVRDAHAALELAQVLHLQELGNIHLASSPVDAGALFAALEALVPGQTNRSEEQIAWQQFATPPRLAWLAARACALAASDRVLEPSAGTGMLALWAAKAGARLALNEISPQRRDCLAALFPQVRHLSQREAGFEREALYKSALDFGLPTTIAQVEGAVRSLVRTGHLIEGTRAYKGWVASREAVETETHILAWAAEGKDAIQPGINEHDAETRVQASAQINHGIVLNEGQLGAARLILSSADRTIAVQGVAGAGKSSVLKPVADVLREQGHQVLGLAVQNTLVQMLERDTGIRSQTLARFLKEWGRLTDEPGNVTLQAEARDALKDHVLVLDEASMVSNADKEQLIRIANLAQVHRLVLMGDAQQLGAVDAGKPFALLQLGGVATAEMTTNLRGRDPDLRQAQAAAQAGLVRTALEHLSDHTIETKGDGAVVAAERWLALSATEREQTAIYASGRKTRSAVNEAVQTGLLANREIGPETIALSVLDRVNLTREELRYPAAYRAGMILDVAKAERSLGLVKGEYRVRGTDQTTGLVRLEDHRGKEISFKPSRMRTTGKEDNLALFEQRKLDIHRGDRIRWTRNDHDRGLFNAEKAIVVAIDKGRVTVQTSKGERVELKSDDPMLRRVDLAYALNAHMAQGLTSDRGIAVMDSRERNLANQKTFLVTVTRLRDHLTLVVDNAARLGGAMSHNKGEKASALEVTERLKAAAEIGASKTREQDVAQSAEQELQRGRSRAVDLGI